MIKFPSLLVGFGVLAGTPAMGARRASFISIDSVGTPRSLYGPFDFDGSVLGDFTSIDMLPTEIVIGYLAQCSEAPLDLDSCVVRTYIERYVTNATFDNECEPPQVPMDELSTELMESFDICVSNNETSINSTEAEEALAGIWTILQSDRCWERLCRRDIELEVESFWIEKCANVMLPYPLPSPNESMMLSPKRVKEDATLTCMLQVVMSTPPSEFGLDITQEGATERCYPPGYNNITEICPEYLGRLAYEKCTQGPRRDSDDETPPMEMDMSFNYDMSYNYFDFDFSMSFDFKPKDEEQVMMLIEDLCTVLEQLSTEKGRECLLPLCDDPTPAPFTMAPSTFAPSSPTMAPSVSPSTPTIAPSESPSSPTMAPSQSPSSPTTAPSSAPSSPTAAPSTSPAPSTAPSTAPSVDPSSRPSLAPSAAPSAVPSYAPSEAPSSVPSYVPSEPPSIAPSDVPSSIPSAAPSSFPSSQPSAAPSDFPTSTPTRSEVQAIMQAQIVSTITVEASNVPLSGPELQEFVTVLENSIAEVISSIPGSETVTVISLNGVPINRRLRSLQEDSVTVEFTVDAQRNCYMELEVCSDEQQLNDYIEEYMTALEMATSTGVLPEVIREVATDMGVTELQTAKVPPDSYTVVSTSGAVVPPDTPTPAPSETSDSPSLIISYPVAFASFVAVLVQFVF